MFMFTCAGSVALGQPPVVPTTTSPATHQPKSRVNLASALVGFLPNSGQFEDEVLYAAQASNAGFFITSDSAVLVLAPAPGCETPGPHAIGDGEPDPHGAVALALEFVGASSDAWVEAVEPSSHTFNDFRGNDPDRWRTGLHTFGAVIYHDLWPGVDLSLDADGRQLKYELTVHPGADIESIRLRYDGVDQLRLDQGGF
jgi:hypothetical protein